MKKLFTVIAFTLTLLATVTTAQAQKAMEPQTSVNNIPYVDPQVAYNHCKMYVKQGNEAYNSGMFDIALTNYEQALDCNMDCPKKKYMTDKKLMKKIDDCKFAINNNGVTRQQINAEKICAVLGAVAAVGAATAAVASVANSNDAPHHDVPHHDYHRDHHFEHHDSHFVHRDSHFESRDSHFGGASSRF